MANSCVGLLGALQKVHSAIQNEALKCKPSATVKFQLQILKSQVTAAQATVKLAVNSEAQVLSKESMEDVLYHYYVHRVLFHVEDYCHIGHKTVLIN